MFVFLRTFSYDFWQFFLFNTKIELQKIAFAEENFSNLKQRLDDIDAELRHQHDQTEAFLQNPNINVHESLSQGTKL